MHKICSFFYSDIKKIEQLFLFFYKDKRSFRKKKTIKVDFLSQFVDPEQVIGISSNLSNTAVFNNFRKQYLNWKNIQGNE